MTPAEQFIADSEAKLQALFVKVEIGKFYDIDLSDTYSGTVSRSVRYKVSGKKKHSNWTYSLSCNLPIPDPVNPSWWIIYHWIVSHSSQTLPRIVGIREAI